MMVERLRQRGDEGGAIVELTFLGVLLLLPLTYALITAFQVQSAAYALTAASRDAGRAAVRADTWESGRASAQDAVDIALEGAGMEPDSVTMTLRCSQDPCLTAGGDVVVRLSTRVPLPWVPPFVDVASSVNVSTQHTATIDTFREDRP